MPDGDVTPTLAGLEMVDVRSLLEDRLSLLGRNVAHESGLGGTQIDAQPPIENVAGVGGGEPEVRPLGILGPQGAFRGAEPLPSALTFIGHPPVEREMGA